MDDVGGGQGQDRENVWLGVIQGLNARTSTVMVGTEI